MVTTTLVPVETYAQELESLRRSFFEHGNGLYLAMLRLPTLLDRLRMCVAHKEVGAIKVLGQALHLSSQIACYQMNFGVCLHQKSKMEECAHETHDMNMMMAALIQHALIHYYTFRPRLRHAVFHRALQLLDKVESPLIRACVFYGYAESLAASGGQDMAGMPRVPAEEYLAQAEALTISNDDPGHAYVRWNPVTRAIHQARFLVARSRLPPAIELLTPLYSAQATLENAEVLFLLAEAHSHMISLRQGRDDTFERACFFIEALVVSSTHMGSLVHHAQAQVCSEFLMQSKWHRQVSERLLPIVCF